MATRSAACLLQLAVFAVLPRSIEPQLAAAAGNSCAKNGQNTSSYGEQAERIGRTGAFRAIGAANGKNPIPIVLPCHRIVGADGSLTGFAGGLAMKQRLLALEQDQQSFDI